VVNNRKTSKMRKICRLFRKLYPKDKAVNLEKILAVGRPVPRSMGALLDHILETSNANIPSVPLHQWIKNAEDPTDLLQIEGDEIAYRKVSGKQVLRVLDRLRAQLGEDPENKFIVMQPDLYDECRFAKEREPTLAELDKVIQLLEREEAARKKEVKE
jgi:hypothetical protein